MQKCLKSVTEYDDYDEKKDNEKDEREKDFSTTLFRCNNTSNKDVIFDPAENAIIELQDHCGQHTNGLQSKQEEMKTFNNKYSVQILEKEIGNKDISVSAKGTDKNILSTQISGVENCHIDCESGIIYKKSRRNTRDWIKSSKLSSDLKGDVQSNAISRKVRLTSSSHEKQEYEFKGTCDSGFRNEKCLTNLELTVLAPSRTEVEDSSQQENDKDNISSTGEHIFQSWETTHVDPRNLVHPVILGPNFTSYDENTKSNYHHPLLHYTLGQTDGDIRSSLPQNMRRNSAFQMSKRSDEECDSGDDGDDDDNVFYENSTISESKSGGNLKYTKFTSPLKIKKNVAVCKNLTTNILNKENKYECKKELKEGDIIENCDKHTSNNGPPLLNKKQASKKLKKRINARVSDNLQFKKRTETNRRKGPKSNKQYNKSEFEITDEERSDIFSYEKAKHSSLLCKSDIHENFSDENNYSSRNERKSYKYLHKSLSFKEEKNALDNGNAIISESTTKNRGTKKLQQNVTTINRSVSQGRKSFRPKIKNRSNKSEFEVTDEGSSDSSSIFLNKNFIDENNYSSRNERNNYKHLHKSLSFKEEENALDDGSDIISESTTTNRKTKRLSLKLKKNKGSSDSSSIFLNKNFIDENNYSSRNERNSYKHLHKSLSFEEEENALDDGSDIISESTTTNRGTKSLSLKLKKNVNKSVSQSRKSFEPKIKNHSNKSEFEVTGEDSSCIFLYKNFSDENNYSSRNERNSYKHLHKSLSFKGENALNDGSDIISESTTTNRGTKSLSLKLKRNVTTINRSVTQGRKLFEPKIKDRSNKSEFEITDEDSSDSSNIFL
ncbi:uncharacterized protein DDB_G0286591-like isoform X2 [Periplaneta americana]